MLRAAGTPKSTFTTFRFGRKGFDLMKRDLNHRLKHQLSNPLTRLYRKSFPAVISQNDANFTVIIGVNHTNALSDSNAMLQRQS